MVNHQGSSNPLPSISHMPFTFMPTPPYASHIRLTDARRRYDPPIIQTSHQFLQGRLAPIFLSFLISLPPTCAALTTTHVLSRRSLVWHE